MMETRGLHGDRNWSPSPPVHSPWTLYPSPIQYCKVYSPSIHSQFSRTFENASENA